jgi:chromosome segregation ATPase
MWTNFRTLASGALETASDIKQHIKEIAAGEYDSEHSEEEENDVEALRLRVAHSEGHLEKVYATYQQTKKDKEELQVTFQRELKEKEAKIAALDAEVRQLRQELESKETQVEELSAHYEEELQMLLREKSSLVHRTQQFSAVTHESKDLQELLATAELKAEQQTLQTEELQRQLELMQERLVEAENRSHDSLDRSFLIHFIGNWYKSPARVQSEMLTSLDSLLKLTEEERSVLGLKVKSEGLLAEFEKYLLSS